MSADATVNSYGLPTKHEFKLPEIITAASAGTVIDWYDFYIFGSLSVFISPLFFPNAAGDPVLSLLVTLLTFWIGFAVRPFGAAVFGHLGDLIGRKYTFLVTLVIMGGATTAIGVIPTYATIGIAAPIIMVALRILQGLALGGEYGGAAIYVAEHAPDGQRGYYTSWIQTTATVGLFISLAVVLATRLSLGTEAFASWGWRIPFLLSFILVMMSLYIRMRLRESPLYAALKESGKTSAQPLKESLGTKRNWKLIALALFGATAGQGVVWYTGQFYALFFLQTALKVDLVTANVVISIALLIGTPLFIVFGKLSDTIGRKKIMMAGCLLAAVLYFPIYYAMAHSVTPPPPGSPATATATDVNTVALTLLVLVQVVFVTMVYGPIAAFLVELFPARIRYTSLSLPYHIGNGVIGGLVPFISTAIVAETGNIYMGLVYPISVAVITLIVGGLYLKETNHVRIWDEVQGSEDEGRVPQPA
ncbi:MAG: MFS transporter [Chloroflexota bacterium]